MSLLGSAYRLVGRRFSTILLFSTASVFVFDFTLNKATDAFWDYHNRGKQWKDIKLMLPSSAGGEQEPEAEED